MFSIAQDQLKRMLAGRQIYEGLRLPCPEMQMFLILWDRLVWIEWLVHIDQEMVMAAVGKIIARVGDPHVAQTEAAPERPLEGRSILGRDYVQKGVLGTNGLRISSA